MKEVKSLDVGPTFKDATPPVFLDNSLRTLKRVIDSVKVVKHKQ